MAKTITLQPLTNEALTDLFLAMAMKEEDRQNAEKAFTELYNRYKSFLFTVIKKACKSWEMYGDELIETVFENTFLTVFDKAETFLKLDDISFERQEKRMKAWLSQIAKNEMLQLLRQYRIDKDKIVFTDDLSFIERIENETVEIISDDILLAEKALQTLNERDRNVLVTYLMYEDGNKKLPSSEIQKLADMWGILPDNMRQIKKRSLAKLEIFIKTQKNK
ncbi:MAG: sigma-70 family RNA polymerase sigma factor [Salinivirgaceae bacterium]|nr:sigma-70 family RNA polymerase sigma factor [Salinivirgaceae bacterium]